MTWFNARYGHEQDNHDWLKVHLMCGVKTNIVTSVAITGGNTNDGPQFPALLHATGEGGGCMVWRKMWHYYHFNRDEFLGFYHKRSNVESTFNMIKGKFGDHLWSKADTAQINEMLCKILCHNICVLIHSLHELGIDPRLGL